MTPSCCLGLVVQARDALFVGHVDGDELRIASALDDLRYYRSARFLGDVCDRDASPFAREAQRTGPADAATGAGDHAHLAV